MITPFCSIPATMADPNFVMPTRVTTRYTLNFSCEVQRHEVDEDGEAKPAKQSQIRQAREDVLNEHIWWEFLGFTMRDVVESEYTAATGHEVYPRDVPPVKVMSLTLTQEADPSAKKLSDNFTGTVVWESISATEPHLKKAIQWRLGDRMCYYGFQSDDWTCITSPDDYTQEPLKAEGPA